MKLAKLSLAAMVVAGLATSSFAADTLADAFAKGKVQGELRAWYFDRDTDDKNTPAVKKKGDADIINTGLMLNYVTDTFYGFYMGATFQSSFAPWADSEAKNLYVGDEWASGAVLSEAYLGYKMKNTNVKIGRQFISTPLVNGSGSRMIKESFQGATIVNTDLPNTTLIAGYVNKFQGRTSAVLSSEEGKAPDFEKAAVFSGGPNAYFDDTYTVAVINQSIKGLTLTGQYAFIGDVAKLEDVNVYHIEGNYLLPLNGFKLGFDLVYRASDTDIADYSGSYFGGRLSIRELGGFGASFAMAQTDDSEDLIAGMGNGADNLYTGTIIRGGTNTFLRDTTSYLFEASYDFSKVGVQGLKLLGQYAYAEQDNTDTEYTTYHIGASYDVAALKGLSLGLQYETQEKEVGTTIKTSKDTDEVRFRANYKF